jgi:hypothetical protein
MTDDDVSDDDIAPDEPVPEPAPPGRPGRPAGRTVRIGLIVLGLLGGLALALGATTASDPEKGRCAQARTILEEDGDVEDASELDCDVAIGQAIALAESDDDASGLSTESTIRTFGLIVAGIGVLQLVGALLTVRLRTKTARLLALVGTGLGIVFSPLGLLGIPILGFVVYAILFSGDARAVFGEPGGPRMFKPRT